METESLQPALEQAQKALETALDEACDVDLRRVNTGELIRIEETLALASKAAKEAVSIRLRLRNQRERAKAGEQPQQDRSRTYTVEAIQAITPITQRIFEDIRGKRWRAFAVHPSAPSLESGALPESFRKGWLTFESDDEMRRVAPIPEGWSEMSTDDLRLICHRAERAPKRVGARDTHLPKPPTREK